MTSFRSVTAEVLEQLQKAAQVASEAEARLRFLSVQFLPTSGSPQEAGWLSGHTAEEIGILEAAQKLKYLGEPAACGKKKLALHEVAALSADPVWQHEAHLIIQAHWKKKNLKTQQKQQPKQP
jgi:hypothetical protein